MINPVAISLLISGTYGAPVAAMPIAVPNVHPRIEARPASVTPITRVLRYERAQEDREYFVDEYA